VKIDVKVGLRSARHPPTETPILPPSEAAQTLSGTILASAPKQQSSCRKPVRARAAVAAGRMPLAMVPGGAFTVTVRKNPSFAGISPGNIDLTAV